MCVVCIPLPGNLIEITPTDAWTTRPTQQHKAYHPSIRYHHSSKVVGQKRWATHSTWADWRTTSLQAMAEAQEQCKLQRRTCRAPFGTLRCASPRCSKRVRRLPRGVCVLFIAYTSGCMFFKLTLFRPAMSVGPTIQSIAHSQYSIPSWLFDCSAGCTRIPTVKS